MPDQTGRVGIELDVQKTGDAAAFADVKRDLDGLSPAARAAGEAIEGVAAAMLKGQWGKAQQELVDAKVALEAYRHELDETKKSGAGIAEGQAAELQRLESDYAAATEAIGQYRKAQSDVTQEIRNTTAAAGGQIPQINSLNDIFRLSGGTIEKWGTTVVAAFAAAKAGYEVGTQLRGVLNEISNGGFDEGVQRLATSLLALDEGVGTAAEESRRLQNEMNVLRQNGIDPTKLSVDQVHEAYLNFTQGLSQHRAELQQTEAAYQKWKEALPPVGAELDKLAKQTSEFITRFAEENKQLSDLQLSKIFGDDINKLLEQYQQLGQEVPEELRGIADSYRLVADAARQSAEQQVAAAGMIPEKLREAKAAVQELVDTYRAAGQEVPAALAMQADAAGVLVGAFERVRPAIDLMKGGIEGGAAGLKVFTAEIAANAQAVDGLVAAAVRLQQILEGGLPGAAKTAAHAIGEVFVGNYGNLVQQTPWGQEMPLIGPNAIHDAVGGG